MQKRKQSQTEKHSDERRKSISCADTVRNGITNPQWIADKRNSNNASNFGPCPVKRMTGISRTVQSTGNQAAVDKDSTLSTTMFQSTPLTTDSVYANVLRVVGNIENETSSQLKSRRIQGDGNWLNGKATAPFDQLIMDRCKRNCAPNSTQDPHLKCKCGVCHKECIVRHFRYHVLARHPEVVFDKKWRQLSTGQYTHFRNSCLKVLEDEQDRGIQLMKEKEEKGYKKKSEKAVSCTYCKSELCRTQHFRVHLFRYHYDKLEKKLKALCRKRVGATGASASGYASNVESTIGTELDQNMEPGLQPNVRFADHVVDDLGKQIISSNTNGQTCSAMVNMTRGLSQNLEHQSNITNTVVGGTSSNWFTTAASTNEGRHGENFHYGNVSDQCFTAWLNDQETGLASGPNMSRNGAIPNVFSNLSFAPFPNHLSQTGISTITENSNNTNRVMMANQVKQYYSTTMTPDNWQYFQQPASVDKEHQVESNQQEILTLNSSQMSSVHPSGSTGIINDAVSERDIDLDIAMEYLQDENFDFQLYF